MPESGKKRNGLATFAIVTALAGGLLYVVISASSEAPKTAAAAVASRSAFPEPKPGENVRIKSQNWRTGGFGTVAIANLTIENGNAYAVKDVKLACHYYAPSGTLLSTLYPTVYETIPAKGRKTMHNFSIGFVHSQAQKGGCQVASASRN